MPSLSDLSQDAINAQVFERLANVTRSQDQINEKLDLLIESMHRSADTTKRLDDVEACLKESTEAQSKLRERTNTTFAVGGILVTIYTAILAGAALLL